MECSMNRYFTKPMMLTAALALICVGAINISTAQAKTLVMKGATPFFPMDTKPVDTQTAKSDSVISGSLSRDTSSSSQPSSGRQKSSSEQYKELRENHNREDAYSNDLNYLNTGGNTGPYPDETTY